MDAVDFIKQFPLRTFVKGEVILSEGDVLDTLLFIDTGFIKVTSLDENGNERLLWIAGQEDIVPSEHFFSHHNQLRFFYTALTEVTARSVNKNKFLEYTTSHLNFMTDVAAGMSDHYDDLLQRVNTIEQANIRDKLLATLRYLAERFGSGRIVDLHAVGLTLTHQDFAEMIGSTRETTSLELQKLRRDGYVSYSRASFVVYLERFSQ